MKDSSMKEHVSINRRWLEESAISGNKMIRTIASKWQMMNYLLKGQSISKEDKFIRLKSDETIKTVIELGCPKQIEEKRTNIENLISRLLNDYKRDFELEKPLSRLEKIGLVISDLMFGLIMYLLTMVIQVIETENVYIFGNEINMGIIVLILIIIVFLFVTVRYSIGSF